MTSYNDPVALHHEGSSCDASCVVEVSDEKMVLLFPESVRKGNMVDGGEKTRVISLWRTEIASSLTYGPACRTRSV
ncbi:hypothetical protein CSUI_007417 [Cystoisospora suis]|uniref:Uncharacterized protein n=1 Tax=Cystoisospora suis TaxID=483139 RepID=A0A2C6KQN5_9APIC|nr:hypothetical protein CSUI_007417 [Cystoisospora suis]